MSSDRSIFDPDAPITVTFSCVDEAQAAFLGLERLRVQPGSAKWPNTRWASYGGEAEQALYYALKEVGHHDF